jgi:hypothetical protein
MALQSSVRLQQYLAAQGIAALERLGEGKDGAVWRTSRWTAVKVHERPESYRAERNAYIRFQQDEGHTLVDMIRERFDERADEVIALCEELASSAGIYLTDVHRHNIKFEGD